MGPTTPVSVPSAGGSKNAIAVCVATRCRRMRCASVVCSPGVATSSRPRTEPICLCFCSTPERAGASQLFPSRPLSTNYRTITILLHYLFANYCRLRSRLGSYLLLHDIAIDVNHGAFLLG